MSTTIEWTQNPDGSKGKTWNPIRGCSRVSPGCDHCYAMGQAHRFSGAGKPFEGLTTIRRGKVDWTGIVRFVPEMLDAPMRWKKPQRIFVNSMSDLFHESLSNEEIAAVFGVMNACHRHTFQVLTKRPKRAAEWFKWVGSLGGIGPYIRSHADELRGFFSAGARFETYLGRKARSAADAWCTVFNAAAVWSAAPLPHVWIGVSVENQQTADERIPLLLELPAAIRFISAEPLLGPVDLREYFCPHASFGGGCWKDGARLCGASCNCNCHRARPSWLIVGGESGPGSREFDLDWARDLVKQCSEYAVPCFVKQLGAKPIDGEHDAEECRVPLRLKSRKGGEMSEWPEELRVREFPG